MRRVQMHHRARGVARLVERAMQRHFLGGGIAGGELAVGQEPRQPRRIEKAERAVGGRRTPAAVVELHADIARGARRQPALEQRAAEPADFLADLAFGHGSTLFAALSHALAARPSRDTERQKPFSNFGLRGTAKGKVACLKQTSQNRASPSSGSARWDLAWRPRFTARALM